MDLQSPSNVLLVGPRGLSAFPISLYISIFSNIINLNKINKKRNRKKKRGDTAPIILMNSAALTCVDLR